jgi:4-hydroxy-3-methylbut-2-enyl diphosphate reductase IspH
MKAPVSVPATCPAIDKVARLVRRLTEPGAPDRKTGLALLEELRGQNAQLRANAAHYEQEAKAATRKFHQVLHQSGQPLPGARR